MEGVQTGRTLLASLTVDVERRKGAAGFEGLNSDVARILDFLRPVCRATFFVAGEIADKRPEIVQAIADEGHEVGCHGLHHEQLDMLPFGEQLRRIALATSYLEKVTGKRAWGFRAPELRANTATLLALEHLRFVYDSSVLPGTVFLRPKPHKKWRFIFAPREPYHPSRAQLTRRGDCRIVELPYSSFILPFVSKLSMRSTLASDIVATILVRLGRAKGIPIIYGLHSYDELPCGESSWLARVVESLRSKVNFTTMDQVALAYGGQEPQ